MFVNSVNNSIPIAVEVFNMTCTESSNHVVLRTSREPTDCTRSRTSGDTIRPFGTCLVDISPAFCPAALRMYGRSSFVRYLKDKIFILMPLGSTKNLAVRKPHIWSIL
jgi:hypothetical protein